MPPTCINCQYDLSGTPRSGLCPECGHAAEAGYAAFDNRRDRPPLHPAAWCAMIVGGLGVLSPLAIFLWIGISNGVSVELDIIFLAVWNMSPFLGLVGLAEMVGRERVPAIATLIVSIAVTVFVWWWYVVFLRANDPLAGMIFFEAPAMAWLGVGPALLAGAYHLIRTGGTPIKRG